jgi:hypothetical protein
MKNPLVPACFLLSVLALPIGPASANPIPISQPTGAYIGGTTLLSPIDPDNTVINSLGPVTFGSGLQELTVPLTWAIWNSPPAVESADPRVLYSNGATTLSLALAYPVQTLGFELQPDLFQQEEVTATFYDGVVVVGTLDLFPSGLAGSLLFAETTTTEAFTSIVINDLAGDDFAIANLRYGQPAIATPEPATLFLFGAGLLAFCFSKLCRLKQSPRA